MDRELINFRVKWPLNVLEENITVRTSVTEAMACTQRRFQKLLRASWLHNASHLQQNILTLSIHSYIHDVLINLFIIRKKGPSRGTPAAI